MVFNYYPYLNNSETEHLAVDELIKTDEEPRRVYKALIY